MNARTVAQIVAVAGVLGTFVVGCAVQTGGEEPTSQTSEAATMVGRLPSSGTYTSPGTSACQSGTLSTSDKFEDALINAGCYTNKTWLATYNGSNVVSNYFEVTCPLAVPAGFSGPSAVSVINSYQSIAPYDPVVEWESTGTCVSATSTTQAARSFPAPSGYFYVDYDPTGCHCNLQ